MDNNHNRLYTNVFYNYNDASQAYDALIARGYDQSDVNILMSDETRSKYFADKEFPDNTLGSKALEGAGVGGAIGGAVGGILAAVAAIGTTLAIPGLGLIIAGPIAAGLAGVGAGGAAGGLIGALVGSGIPEERAKEYENAIQNGGIVIGLKTRSDDDYNYFTDKWKS